jgi:hypothetical protein
MVGTGHELAGVGMGIGRFHAQHARFQPVRRITS